MKVFKSLILVLLLSGLNLYGRQALNFEAFFEAPRLGNPVVSADGNRIAFTVTQFNVNKNDSRTVIYVIDANGKQVKRIGAEKSVGSPLFDRNGVLYYISNGDLYSENSSEALLDLKVGVSGVHFQPGGPLVLFKSKVYPDCPDMDCVKLRDEEREENPVKARIYDRLMYRHWNTWWDGKRSHLFLSSVNGGEIRDITPGDFDSPPIALGSGHDYCFSPDGKEIAFVSNHDEVIATSTNNDVFIIPVTGGKTMKISESKGNDTYPLYSPDGKWIAFLSMKRAGFESDRNRIMIYDRSNNTLQEYTTGFENTVREMVWSPDSRFIYFTAPEKGKYAIYALDITDRKIDPVLRGHFIQGLTMPDTGTLVFSLQTASNPKEIFKYDITDRRLVQLTRIAEKTLAAYERPVPESFWFTGADGDQVQGFILKPPHFEEGKKYPAIELIHGGPQGMFGDQFHYRWNYQMFASRGYVVFWINFHGSIGYGQKFTDSISKHWGDKPFEDIIKGTQFVLENYSFIDKDRIGAAGASYGGFMINWIEGHDNPFKCLVSHDGVYDQTSMWGATEELWFPEWEMNGLPWEEGSLYRKWSPSRLAENFKTPILIIHGEQDFRVPYTQGLQLFNALQRRGVPSKLLFFPDEDHFVRKPQNAGLWWKTVHEWFEKYLKK